MAVDNVLLEVLSDYPGGGGDFQSDGTVVMSGTLKMDEVAAAEADVAGDGQFWWKNTAPNMPMATDDAGNDYALLDGQAFATKAAIQALDITNGDIAQVYLTLAYQEGPFVWDSSDLSTEVTNDPDEALYLAPDSDATGASGAWVRKHDGRLNVCWWGMKPTSAFDNLAAWDALVTHLNTNPGNQVIYIPQGEFEFSATAQFTVPRCKIIWDGTFTPYTTAMTDYLFEWAAPAATDGAFQGVGNHGIIHGGPRIDGKWYAKGVKITSGFFISWHDMYIYATKGPALWAQNGQEGFFINPKILFCIPEVNTVPSVWSSSGSYVNGDKVRMTGGVTSGDYQNFTGSYSKDGTVGNLAVYPETLSDTWSVSATTLTADASGGNAMGRVAPGMSIDISGTVKTVLHVVDDNTIELTASHSASGATVKARNNWGAFRSKVNSNATSPASSIANWEPFSAEAWICETGHPSGATTHPHNSINETTYGGTGVGGNYYWRPYWREDAAIRLEPNTEAQSLDNYKFFGLEFRQCPFTTLIRIDDPMSTSVPPNHEFYATQAHGMTEVLAEAWNANSVHTDKNGDRVYLWVPIYSEVLHIVKGTRIRLIGGQFRVANQRYSACIRIGLGQSTWNTTCTYIEAQGVGLTANADFSAGYSIMPSAALSSSVTFRDAHFVMVDGPDGGGGEVDRIDPTGKTRFRAQGSITITNGDAGTKSITLDPPMGQTIIAEHVQVTPVSVDPELETLGYWMEFSGKDTLTLKQSGASTGNNIFAYRIEQEPTGKDIY